MPSTRHLQPDARHPGLRDRVLTETGEIGRHVNVADGAEVSILPAVSGG
jgi:hypothetical protein